MFKTDNGLLLQRVSALYSINQNNILNFNGFIFQLQYILKAILKWVITTFSNWRENNNFLTRKFETSLKLTDKHSKCLAYSNKTRLCFYKKIIYVCEGRSTLPSDKQFTLDLQSWTWGSFVFEAPCPGLACQECFLCCARFIFVYSHVLDIIKTSISTYLVYSLFKNFLQQCSTHTNIKTRTKKLL